MSIKVFDFSQKHITEANSVTIITNNGEITLLKNHISILLEGKIKKYTFNNQEQYLNYEGIFLFKNNTLKMLYSDIN